MNGKIAAVLLAATMLTTPAFAAAVANSHNTAATQTVIPHQVTKTSDKGVKKHRIHARVSHGHKVHQAKHTMPKHAKSTKCNARTVAALHLKAPVKN
jgi:hypothetical protein